MVSTHALKEFKEIYKSEYGIELNNQTAMELAERYFTLFKAVYRPIKLKPAGAGKDGYGKQKNVR